MSDLPRQLYFRMSKRPQPDFPLLIFLPGMDGTGKLLRSQTEGLEQAYDVRCLTIPPDDLTNWEQLAEGVVELVEAEAAQKPGLPVYLCGESFGGCLALKTILRSPNTFDYLILVNPASSFMRRPFLVCTSHLVRPTLEGMYQLGCVVFMPFLAALERIAIEERQALLQAMQSVSQQAAIWRMSLLREFQVTDAELQQITHPTLVVASQRDRLLPSVAEAHRLIQHFPQARLHVLPNSGHAALLENEVNLYEILQTTFPQMTESALEASR